MSNNNHSIRSSNLFEFSSIPSHLTLSPPSLYSSQSVPVENNNNNNNNAVNSLEFPVYRGLRLESSGGNVGVLGFNDLNNSFNANNSYWSDNYNNVARTNNKKDLSLANLHLTSTPTIVTILLKNEPSYIEKYTSFYSDSALSELVSSIESSLLTHAVDFSFTKEKSKFQCVAYDCFNNAVQFLIKIYKANSGGENNKLVEFQRRIGCSLAYTRAYQSIYKSISTKKTPYIQKFNSVPCEPVPTTDINNILPSPQPLLDDSSLSALCNMANSADLTSARDSLKCLSSSNLLQVAKSAESSKLLLSTIQNVLSKAIKDDEQERLCSQILCNFSEFTPIHSAIINNLFSHLMNCLDSPITKSSTTSSTGCLQSRCTKRYLSKLMNVLSHSQPKLFSSILSGNEEYISILKKFEYVVDNQVSENIKSTLRNIQSC